MSKPIIGSSLYVDLKDIKKLHDAWKNTSVQKNFLNCKSPYITFDMKLREDIHTKLQNKYGNLIVIGGSGSGSSIFNTDKTNHITVAYFTGRIAYNANLCGCEFEEKVVLDLTNELNKIFKQTLGLKTNSFSNFGQRISCLHHNDDVELKKSTAVSNVSFEIMMNTTEDLVFNYVNMKQLGIVMTKIKQNLAPTAEELASLMGSVNVNDTLAATGFQVMPTAVIFAQVINNIFGQFATSLISQQDRQGAGSSLVGFATAHGNDKIIVTMNSYIAGVPIWAGGNNWQISPLYGDLDMVKINNYFTTSLEQKDQVSVTNPLGALHQEWLNGLSKVIPVAHHVLPDNTETIPEMKQETAKLSDFNLDDLPLGGVHSITPSDLPTAKAERAQYDKDHFSNQDNVIKLPEGKYVINFVSQWNHTVNMEIKNNVMDGKVKRDRLQIDRYEPKAPWQYTYWWNKYRSPESSPNNRNINSYQDSENGGFTAYALKFIKKGNQILVRDEENNLGVVNPLPTSDWATEPVDKSKGAVRPVTNEEYLQLCGCTVEEPTPEANRVSKHSLFRLVLHN